MEAWQSSILSAVITAPLAAWLTAHFSLRRFYSEKVWERKVAAYSTIFEALHDMEQCYERHYKSAGSRDELPDDVSDKLWDKYTESKEKLLQRVSAEAWIVAPDVRVVIAKLFEDLAFRHKYWIEMLDEGLWSIKETRRKLEGVVQKDLHLTPSAVIRCITFTHNAMKRWMRSLQETANASIRWINRRE